jgi:hypothetical protein
VIDSDPLSCHLPMPSGMMTPMGSKAECEWRHSIYLLTLISIGSLPDMINTKGSPLTSSLATMICR